MGGHVGRVARERIAPATRLRSERVSPSERDEGSATGFRVPRPAPSPPRPASRECRAQRRARRIFNAQPARAFAAAPLEYTKVRFFEPLDPKTPRACREPFPRRTRRAARAHAHAPRRPSRSSRRRSPVQGILRPPLPPARRERPRPPPPGIPEFVHRPPPAPSPLAMSWVFEHPNAKGVLLPGQTKCHTGRLVPRVDPRDPLADPFEPEHCPKLCSPRANSPIRPRRRTGRRTTATTPRARRNLSSPARPQESSRERLTGCAPCGCALKWSCCGACCGACTVWSRDGFLRPTRRTLASVDPVAAEYASWDGCTPIPDDVALPPAAPRSELGERLGRVDVGRGSISPSRVCAGERMAVGLLDGSAAVYDVHLLEDDLAPTLVGVIQPGRPAVPCARARARGWTATAIVTRKVRPERPLPRRRRRLSPRRRRPRRRRRLSPRRRSRRRWPAVKEGRSHPDGGRRGEHRRRRRRVGRLGRPASRRPARPPPLALRRVCCVLKKSSRRRRRAATSRR